MVFKGFWKVRKKKYFFFIINLVLGKPYPEILFPIFPTFTYSDKFEDAALPFVKVADLKSDSLNVPNPDIHNVESFTEPINNSKKKKKPYEDTSDPKLTSLNFIFLKWFLFFIFKKKKKKMKKKKY
jgi:hypothetical protein